MAKRTVFSRFSSGILEACRDLFAPYASQSATTFDDDGTVAAVEVQANELAAPVDENGNAAAQTAAPIGTGSYTSNVFRTQGFGRIVGTVYSDNATSLKVEQSPDGTNWDAETDVSVSAATKTSFSVEVVAPYARVSIADTGTQVNTVLRLFTWLRRTGTA